MGTAESSVGTRSGAAPRQALTRSPRFAVASLAAAALAACAPPVATAADGPGALLDRFAPVLREDARDRYPSVAVDAFLAGASPRAAARPDAERVVYGRVARGSGGRIWLQYWRFSTYNPQDRGLLRTGRHEGDWEFTQVGLSPTGVPERMTLAQHAWAEACPWSRVTRASGGRPVVYVANGSHASYRTAGEHGRPWPDPDDEARGDGRRVRPRVVVIDDRRPAWVTRREPWGRTRASWIPAESSAPAGPMFQADGRWQDPDAFHARARACGSGAPGRPPLVTLGLAAPPLLVAVAVAGGAVRVRRQRQRRRRGRAGVPPGV